MGQKTENSDFKPVKPCLKTDLEWSYVYMENTTKLESTHAWIEYCVEIDASSLKKKVFV